MADGETEIEPLSQYFLSQIRDMDRDSDKFTERFNEGLGGDERLGPMSGLIDWYSELVESLEGFSRRDHEQVISFFRKQGERDSARLDRCFDEFFVRHFLGSVPRYVERLKRLSPLTPLRAPTPEIHVYLREATRCCVFGQWDASIALTRVALEQALKCKIRERLKGLKDPSDDDLNCLINDHAGKLRLLDHPYLQMAHRVRRTANKVLHDGVKGTEDEAWEALASLKEPARCGAPTIHFC
jgi:hypothetical protein